VSKLRTPGSRGVQNTDSRACLDAHDDAHRVSAIGNTIVF